MIWWIGGAPCSGKSTVAGLLAGARDLPLYSCDDAFERHGGPTFDRIRAMSVGDRLAQPVEVQVEDVFRLGREQFPAILAELPETGIAEGAALLPELLDAHGVPRDRAVFVVPAEEFQRRQYRRREWARELVAGTADPEGAFDRWMERDATFARLVADQARDLGYPVVTVDGSEGAEDIAAAVSVLFDWQRGSARP
ncbi:hypothetical protein ACQP1P_25350 [Dactylosporangium sp. CA-052675]|uniref:hypothetical protein n=1 Tax=Dactylosporangium sp. CA-052675 TaxID=3239927 RepID=UPI003D8F5BC2